jgi:hypothetical protein
MGSGFVLDANHVMTCAHVVGDCLGRRKQLIDSPTAPPEHVVFDMPMAPQHSVRAVVVPAKWYPERIRQNIEDTALIDDVAVLRLLDGEVLPAGWGAVTTVPAAAYDDQVFAFGTDADKRDVSYVVGRLIEQVMLRRSKLVADPPGVRAGCSGAAVWNMARGGIAGMIAEKSSDTSGLVIPISTLAEVWPNFRRADAPPGPRVRRQNPVRKLLRDELSQRLCHFDRTAQASEFETFAIEDYDVARRPMLCVIVGLERDAPRLCRDKCRQKSLQRRLDALGIPSRLVDPRRLPWPESKRFDATVEFNRLRNMLGDELGARGGASDMRRAYVRTGRPLILYSEVLQSSWSDDQARLLGHWGHLWSQLGEEACTLPLVHFLLVRLNDNRFNPGKPQLAYDRFERFASEMTAATGSIARALPPLRHVEIDEVESWINALSDEVEADVADLEKAKLAARRALGAIRHPRLADLEAWIERLRM